MKKLIKDVSVVVFALSFWAANSAFAKMTSDAEGYAEAGHRTAKWQMLGGDNNADDGVWWSKDGGGTWGHEDLLVGDKVSFRFDLWSSGTGLHDYNQVEAWVDWNQDSFFDDATEMVLSQTDPLVQSAPYTTSLFSDSYLITDAMIGDLWLRARAQCDHVPFGQMTPYGNYWQGEVEDWKLVVRNTDVPEPASILLLGLGLLGLTGARIRRA